MLLSQRFNWKEMVYFPGDVIFCSFSAYKPKDTKLPLPVVDCRLVVNHMHFWTIHFTEHTIPYSDLDSKYPGKCSCVTDVWYVEWLWERETPNAELDEPLFSRSILTVLWAGGEQSANTADLISTHLLLFWVNWLNNYPQVHLSSGTSLVYLGFFRSEDGREEEPGEVIHNFPL